MTAILTCSPATRDYGRSDIARSVRFHGTDVSTIEPELAAQRLGARPLRLHRVRRFQFFSPFLPLYVRELGVTDPSMIALWWQFLVMRFLQGLFAGFSPMAMAVASVSAPRDKVSIAIARVQGAQLLNAAVGPAAGGFVASHLGIRPAFYVTASMCALALVALIVLFREARPLEAGEGRRAARATPLGDVLRFRHFIPVMVLLLIAQFIDRALGLLIPLQVAHMPGVTAEAATSGVIISVAAVGAALAANVGARVAEGVPVGQLLVGQLVVGGMLCGAMALGGAALLFFGARDLLHRRERGEA
jgi:MFS transporter, DHA1 family, multidrug resistance protein